MSAAVFTFATDVQVHEWARHVFPGLVETLMQVRFLGVWLNARHGRASHSLAASDVPDGLAFRWSFKSQPASTLFFVACGTGGKERKGAG